MIKAETTIDLRRIITEKIQESAQIEFKRQLPESGKNDDLAKDIAAMANSGGGLIIYGIEEESGIASGLAPFDLTGVVERVALVATTIDEPPRLTSIVRIMDGNVGYLVVQVAPATRGPHLVKGQAWGRTAGGNTTLTRRQIGELFARSEGFAAEFGLAVGLPGRAVATLDREEHQRISFGKFDIDTAHYVVLANDGDTPVHSVGWRWKQESEGTIVVPNDLQPIATLHAHSAIRIRVLPTDTATISGIVTTWVDPAGQGHEELWPVSLW